MDKQVVQHLRQIISTSLLTETIKGMNDSNPKMFRVDVSSCLCGLLLTAYKLEVPNARSLFLKRKKRKKVV